MRTLRVILICLSAMIISMAFIRPDDMVQALNKKLWTYQKEHPATLLHLHLDKTIYNTNEDIWFKAYILNPEADSSDVLYVRLTDLNKKIILTDQFPITDVRANGDMLIPDTLKDGNYYLYAYTNRMINYNSKNIFVQRITVTHNSAKRLLAEAAVLDTNELKRGHKVQIQVRVKDGDDLLKNIKGEYKLIAEGLPVKVGKLSTNQFGEATFSFIYPDLANDKSLNVNISFKNNTDFADLTLNLKHEGNPVQVSLLPEGGHYITGVNTRTIVRATDIKANPIAAGIVVKNGQNVIAALKLDKSGQGVFYFKPEPNATYTIEAESNGNKTTIPFNGKIENKGYNLSVVKQRNDVKVTVRNIGSDNDAMLVLRSFDEILWSQPVTVTSGDSAVVMVPAGKFDKQVLNIAAFNTTGDLLSERLFLNKMADDYKVSIKTDQQIYGARKKVTVTVHVADAEGNPVKANLSVSAAAKDRIDAADQVDILNTWYLKFMDSNNSISSLSGMSEANIDAMMITKNWRQYHWGNVLSYQPRGMITRLKNTDGVIGFLKPLRKKPSKLHQLTIWSKAGFFTIVPDKDNYFSIPAAELIRDRSQKQYLLMNEDLAYDYEVNLFDYPKEFDENVKAGNALFIPEAFNTLARYEEIKQSFSKGVIQLKEVKISGSTSTSTEQNSTPIYVSKNCTDLVCMYNILNCKNHPNCCSIPVEGGVYNLNGKAIIYHGCAAQDVEAKTHIPLKGISIPKKFYLPDYDKEPSFDAELHSTVYWNPNLNTDMYGNATFTFFTSDITGDFTINAQGVDGRNIMPLSGKGGFKVK